MLNCWMIQCLLSLRTLLRQLNSARACRPSMSPIICHVSTSLQPIFPVASFWHVSSEPVCATTNLASAPDTALQEPQGISTIPGDTGQASYALELHHPALIGFMPLAIVSCRPVLAVDLDRPTVSLFLSLRWPTPHLFLFDGLSKLSTSWTSHISIR